MAHSLISSGGHYLLRSPRGARNSALAHYARVYLVFRRREAIIAHSRNNVLNLRCGTQRARRDFQAASSPHVKVWLSGALFRLRKSECEIKYAPNNFRAKSSTLDRADCPERGNTITPSCGFPQKSFPPKGPHDFRGHLRRSRKSDIAAEAGSSAAYATCRHAPRPKGEQRARGCVLCELRSALTRSAPVAPPRSE